MPFPISVKEEALVRSRRCCCLCNGFAGRYSYVHHIIQEAKGGSNELENAIVLCDRCHGEVRHYAPDHPIGNKYRPEELRRLRDAWWAYMAQHPVIGLPRHPLVVSPLSLTLPARVGETEFAVLDLTNTSTDVLHSVVIGIVFPLGQSETWEVRWGVPPVDYMVEQPETRVRLNMGLLALGGTTSPTGQEFLLLFLGRLPPGHHQLETRFSCAGQPVSVETPTASVQLLDFGLDPPRLIQRPSPTFAGWHETLLRVWLFDGYKWLGFATTRAGPTDVERG